MPIDNKRLPTPETSQHPHVFVPQDLSFKNINLIKDEVREDERSRVEARPVFLKTGVISQAKGSSYVEMGQTKIICAVYGPREVTRREDFSMRGQLECMFKYATFSRQKRRGHQQDNEEKDCSAIILEALEPAVCLDKIPKARLDVFITVLQDDGSALAAAITCASVALADASIEMYDLVLGSSVRQLNTDVVLDPSGREEYSRPQTEGTEQTKLDGQMTVGYMPSLRQVSALAQVGQMDCARAAEAIKICVDACDHLYTVAQTTLTRAVRDKMNRDCGERT